MDARAAAERASLIGGAIVRRSRSAPSLDVKGSGDYVTEVDHESGNDGGVQTCAYTIEGSEASYSGIRVLAEKQAKTRGVIVFAPDSMSWTSKEEISVDGKTWMPNFENKFTKVKSSPK